jgi:hypothetical protein
MENDNNTTKGKIVYEGTTFHYEVRVRADSDLHTGWRDLDFTDNKGHEAAVLLLPKDKTEEKIVEVIKLRKWF